MFVTDTAFYSNRNCEDTDCRLVKSTSQTINRPEYNLVEVQ